MRRLLLESNNITWTQTVFWCNSELFPTLQKETFEALSKTRYSSRSLKRLQVSVTSEEDKSNVLSFLQTGCEVLETLEIRVRDTNFSLTDLASSRALANSLNRLVWSYQPIPDSQQFQFFSRLQELRLSETWMNDEQLHPLALLKNLRRLEIVKVSSCSGSFLDVVCPSLKKLHVLEIRNCSDFRRVSGLKHLANSLEELRLKCSVQHRALAGHEEWVEFPFLKELDVGRVSFGHQENFALSPDAFPSLDILEFEIMTASEPFHTKILEGCQRESSRPFKQVDIHYHLAKEGFEALLMVPAEELNLYRTRPNSHISLDISLDIPWGEEKIITKTLKNFKWVDYREISSIAFLNNCKQLESLQLFYIPSNIDLSALANLPRLKEFSFMPYPYGTGLFLIKDLFRSTGENNVVLPSLQKLELKYENALPCFEGLENIFPNLRILVSSARVDKRKNDQNLLNSFLYLVRNFPKLEEIRFSGKSANLSDTIFTPMQTQIPRLLKKEKPSLIIYYPISCQFEPEPEKEGSRRDRE